MCDHISVRIGYIFDPLLFHSILMGSADSAETNPLIIGNKLVHKILGGEHTVVCLIGLN